MNADRPDSRPEDPDHGLDIDAAFAEIVANWGPTGDADEAAPAEPLDTDEPPTGTAPAKPADEGPAPDQDSLASLFRPAWQEPPNRQPPEPTPDPPSQDPRSSPATWDDEGHFVPPPPPPLPPVDPRRKIAWAGLLGGPVAALLLVLFDVVIPGWVSVFLVASFVGGFGYLVATMRSSTPDDWSGDDGAVV
jgi:hypothetical protein